MNKSILDIVNEKIHIGGGKPFVIIIKPINSNGEHDIYDIKDALQSAFDLIDNLVSNIDIKEKIIKISENNNGNILSKKS